MLTFENLTPQQQKIANDFFNEVCPYFEIINKNTEFQNFLSLFSELCIKSNPKKELSKIQDSDIFRFGG